MDCPGKPLFVPILNFLVHLLGVEGERTPTHEKLPDPRHRRGILCWGRGQQQKAVQEACRSVHPPRPEEAALHPCCGETQDALQKTHQDHPQGTAAGVVEISRLLTEWYVNVIIGTDGMFRSLSLPPRQDQTTARAWTLSAVWPRSSRPRRRKSRSTCCFQSGGCPDAGSSSCR